MALQIVHAISMNWLENVILFSLSWNLKVDVFVCYFSERKDSEAQIWLEQQRETN